MGIKRFEGGTFFQNCKLLKRKKKPRWQLKLRRKIFSLNIAVVELLSRRIKEKNDTRQKNPEHNDDIIKIKVGGGTILLGNQYSINKKEKIYFWYISSWCQKMSEFKVYIKNESP